jgi:endonuclease-8
MPEGPEIRREADRIAKRLVGKLLSDVQIEVPKLRRFEARLAGSRVTAVDTAGKAMLTRFDNGLTLYSHNQLYGRWYVTRRPRLPSTQRQLRVGLHTRTHSALLYSASDVDVLTDRQLAKHPFLTRIGPDILDPGLDSDAVLERLASTAFSGRALGSLYLDQRFLAGIGNYLRSEILWAARLDPWTRPAACARHEMRRLARQTLAISRRSYRTGGVTMTPSLNTELRERGLPFEEHRFWVFGRDGLPCYECGSTVERQDLGSRRIYICRECQPTRR